MCRAESKAATRRPEPHCSPPLVGTIGICWLSHRKPNGILSEPPIPTLPHTHRNVLYMYTNQKPYTTHNHGLGGTHLGYRSYLKLHAIRSHWYWGFIEHVVAVQHVSGHNCISLLAG